MDTILSFANFFFGFATRSPGREAGGRLRA